MKRIVSFLLLIALSGTAGALSLDSCIRMMAVHYPLLKQQQYINEAEQNNINQENKNWIPRLSFLTRATYQSEVISFQGVTFPHDSYLAALDLEQVLFDAGQNKQQKDIVKLNAEIDRNKNSADFFTMIERLNQVYSGILLGRENIRILESYKEVIEGRRKIISESVKNGLVLQSNLDELDAEELRTDQMKDDASEQLKALYRILTIYINLEVSDATELTAEPVGADNLTDNRPELKLFEAQRTLMQTRHKLNNRLAMPRLSVTAEGAYGRPGPNFLNQDLRFFGQASVNLKWNIGSLYTLSNEKSRTGLSSKMVDLQQEIFEYNRKNNIYSQEGQISALNDMIAKDKLIIEKRKNITRTASVQLESGTITSTDYIIQLNAEMQAVLNQKIHEVKLMNTISSYHINSGHINYNLN